MEWRTTRVSLLARLRHDPEGAAWREFDQQYGDLILRYCLRSGLQLADAEDVRQTVLLGLVRVMPRFELRRELGGFRNYLGRTVRNAITRHRSRRLRTPSTTGTTCTDTIPSAPGSREPQNDEIWEDEWRRHHLRTALAEVRKTHDTRSVAVFERLLAGERAQEIAREFGLRTDAVYKIKQRMRDRLQDLVAEQLQAEAESSGIRR